MKGRAVALVFLVAIATCMGGAQPAFGNDPVPVSTASPFLSHGSALPSGHFLRLSGAFSPFARGTRFGYGSATVGIAGLFSISLSHEGAIGSPIGALKPNDLLDIRLQIIPQRDRLPAVSLFLTTMTAMQTESFRNTDLQSALPDAYAHGLSAISYEARTSAAGVAVTTVLSDLFAFGASVGAREMVWSEGWSHKGNAAGGAVTNDGWTGPGGERSTFRLDWSAHVIVRPLTEVALVVELASQPLAAVNPTTLSIEGRQGYTRVIGIRYFLPIPLSVDLYDRWYSEQGSQPAHQVRLGLSASVALY
jgi:hypothetical protein